jgi:F420-0:gamma-glutamyl ligase
MGEGAEQQPLAMITDFPLEWTNEAPDPNELKIPLEDDLYGPLFGALKK